MLKKLKIANYAIIENLEIEFHDKFNIITGETGSGKSIIIGALGLITGQRSDVSILRNKEKKCVVEAIFDIKKYNLKKFFDQKDIDYFNETIIRREIAPNGRTRAFINDTPVNVSILKELKQKLIDIHSQHDTLLLDEAEFQLSTLDVFAKNTELKKEYRKLYENYKQIIQTLKEIQQKAIKEKQEKDYYEFQFKQLDEAALDKEELEQLETEHKELSHSEDIKFSLSQISSILNGEENSVIQALKTARQNAINITEFFPKAAEFEQRLETAIIELQDLANEADFANADLEFDPQRFEYITARIDTIYGLMHKFNTGSVEELIDLKNKFQKKLLQINSFDQDILKLEKEKQNIENKLQNLANKLSEKRKSALKNFEKLITELLQKLGMPKAQFKVLIEKNEKITKNGHDKITFLFSSAADLPVKPLSKIASGGEMSRIMLALKYVISNAGTLPTIIFDEIDTGISGKTADQTGNLIKEMSRNIQIIMITHSPQIASKADTHLVVTKKEKNNKTITEIIHLNKNQRIQEIAKMISGSEITPAAISAAQNLLSNTKK